MARYVSKSERLRRIVAVALACAVVAFALGWLYGRQQVPSVGDQVAAARDRATLIATGIERLDIEYQQVLSGTDGETLERGVLAPLDELRVSLQQAMDDAPWLTAAQRAAALDALATARAAAEATATQGAFTASLGRAATVVRQTFGVSG